MVHPMSDIYGYTNGSYDICAVCGSWGTPKAVMGTWIGTCDICGASGVGIANAKHDYALSDEEVERLQQEEWDNR